MSRNATSNNRPYSPFHFFPCLRCARLTVAALIPQPSTHLEMGDLICKECGAPHYLIAKKESGFWRVIYERDTRRYPYDHYDESPFTGLSKHKNVRLANCEEDNRPFPQYGQILIYKRKRFSSREIHTIWLRSGCKCHLCGKRWQLNQHGNRGWHIDHEIPNSGGGRDTEMLRNFLVACAKCNLKKGNGRPRRLVDDALRRLLMQ
jgi:5-methylcytosine-specific restriction endonuclease McrA